MPNTFRWRYGDTNPVLASVDAATVIEIGDLVYQEVDDARPASLQPDAGTKQLNQQVFQDKFLGVAMQASAAGQTVPIRVATTGVFEFDCTSATYELGDLVGPNENAAGTALLNQTVEKVVVLSSAIARVARRVAPAGTRVLAEISSTVMQGGPQASA